MQIYVFRCKSCGMDFEDVIYTPLDLMQVSCPECGSDDFEVIDIINACSPFG